MMTGSNSVVADDNSKILQTLKHFKVESRFKREVLRFFVHKLSERDTVPLKIAF